MVSFIAFQASLLALFSAQSNPVRPNASYSAPSTTFSAATSLSHMATKLSSVVFGAFNVTEGSTIGNWINFATTTPTASPISPQDYDETQDALFENACPTPSEFDASSPPDFLCRLDQNGRKTPFWKQTATTYVRFDHPTTLPSAFDGQTWIQEQTTSDRLLHPTTFVTHIFSSLQSASASWFTTPESSAAKNPTFFSHLVGFIDPRYNEYASQDLVGPCTLNRFHLGFPYGVFADRFWASTHAPVCIPVEKNRCATSFFESPIRYFVDFFNSCATNKQTTISRDELNEAIYKWVADEMTTAPDTASLYINERLDVMRDTVKDWTLLFQKWFNEQVMTAIRTTVKDWVLRLKSRIIGQIIAIFNTVKDCATLLFIFGLSCIRRHIGRAIGVCLVRAFVNRKVLPWLRRRMPRAMFRRLIKKKDFAALVGVAEKMDPVMNQELINVLRESVVYRRAALDEENQRFVEEEGFIYKRNIPPQVKVDFWSLCMDVDPSGLTNDHLTFLEEQYYELKAFDAKVKYGLIPNWFIRYWEPKCHQQLFLAWYIERYMMPGCDNPFVIGVPRNGTIELEHVMLFKFFNVNSLP